MEEPVVEEHKLQKFIPFIVIALLVVAGVLFYFNSGKANTQTAQSSTQAQIPSETTGNFTLVSDGGETVPVGNKAVVRVVADSGGKDVVGYDIVLSKPSNMQGLVVTSLVPGFQVFTNEGDDYVSITGIKGLDSQDAHIFSGSPLVQVEFVPTAAGEVALSLYDEHNNETTKFVDTQTTLYYPGLSGLTLQVQ